MTENVPENDLILICPKGPDYSTVSDDYFTSELERDTYIQKQVSLEIWASWKYNAKTIYHNQKRKHATSDGGISESTTEGTFHRAQYFLAADDTYKLVFADKHAFPDEFVGGDGTLDITTGSVPLNAFYEKDEFARQMLAFGKLFYHRDKWYFRQFVYLSNALENVTRTVTTTVDKITLVEVYIANNPDTTTTTYTYTTIWTITDKFYL